MKKLSIVWLMAFCLVIAPAIVSSAGETMIANSQVAEVVLPTTTLAVPATTDSDFVFNLEPAFAQKDIRVAIIGQDESEENFRTAMQDPTNWRYVQAAVSCQTCNADYAMGTQEGQVMFAVYDYIPMLKENVWATVLYQECHAGDYFMGSQKIPDKAAFGVVFTLGERYGERFVMMKWGVDYNPFLQV